MSAVSAPETGHHAGAALLAAEARVRAGTVPDRLGGRAMVPGSMWLEGDQFILRTTTGYAFHYARGEGVTMARTPDADPAEQELWLGGSVYAAIAAIHGFLPFHASAVAWKGQVYAFSGPSGAGKSTLVAALGRHGLPLFCDDTLVLDLSDPDQVVCLPGHKRLKLTVEALALSGARGGDLVSPAIAKRYAEPIAGTLREILPLAQLTFIEDGDGVMFEPILGAARIARIDDDHYTAELYAQARAEGLPARFTRIAMQAARIPMQCLARPRDTARFDALVAIVADQIQQGAQP